MAMSLSGTLWHTLDDGAISDIGDAALRLLTHTGARVEHEEMLGRLEAAGCRIDRSEKRCRFSEALIHEATAKFGGHPPEKQAAPPPPWTAWHPSARLGQIGSHPHLLEWPQCRRRLATADDVRDMVKMAHVLDEFSTIGQALSCCEISPALEPLWNAVTRMSLTDKALAAGEVMHPQTIAYLAEFGRIYSGKPDVRFIASCDFIVAPLHFGRRVVECMIEKSRLGVTHQPGTMPISGASTPVTIAGTVAVAVAELLAGWAIYYLLDPNIRAWGTVASGHLDMKTSRACFGSPEALLQNVATIEVCRRRFGMYIGMAANYVDCKVPGLDAAYAKMMPLVAAPLVGWGCLCGDGLLSAGQDYSPVQHLLELDFLQGLGQFCQGFVTNADTLAVDLIDEIARRPGAGFTDTDHTIKYFRGQWHPHWLDRASWRGDAIEQEHEHRMLSAIDAHIRNAIARYEPPDIDRGKLAEAKDLLARAEVELADVKQEA
jgi:trimethylamine---corrinoid protein Co-methyltransferase